MLPNLFAKMGLRLPLFQAPTGSIAGPELAAAVAAAGGMGAMALTWTDPEDARRFVRQVRASTTGTFQVNFALAFAPKSLLAALEEGAPCVTFSWGDPLAFLPAVRRAGATVGIQVVNAEGARRAAGMGADFLICQGMEAGGHVQSTRPLFELLPQVLECAGALPVVASGGIGSGRDMARALAAGAGGAMLGTRFVAAQESRAHLEYKHRLVEADTKDTSLTVCFDGGWPYAAHRVLRTATLETWEGCGSPPLSNRPGEGDIMGHTQAGEPILRYDSTAPRAGMTGDIGEMCLYAGTSCEAIDDIAPAAALVARLWADCTAALRELQSRPA